MSLLKRLIGAHMKTEYPFYETVDEFETVKDVVAVLKTYQDNPVFRYKQGKEIKEKSKGEFTADVQRIGQLFHEKNEKGSHIALLEKTSYVEIERQNRAGIMKIVMKSAWLLYRCRIDIRRKLFEQILEQLGWRLRIMVVGGAHIEPKLIKDFETWGITIAQGYGITECVPVISCNTDRCRKYASVGKVVTCSEVRIVEKEIWVRGPTVMKGYYKNLQETAQMFDDEWFKSRDWGYLDQGNFLYITGRKKNLIILPNREMFRPKSWNRRFSFFLM